MQVVSRFSNVEGTVYNVVPLSFSCVSSPNTASYISLPPLRRKHMTGKIHCVAADEESNAPQDSQGTPQQQSYNSGYAVPRTDPYRTSYSARRRPYNLEAKMRMKQYRREAEMQRRQMELEEQRRNFQLDYSTIYQKGAPGTMQGVIKEIIHLGYFVSLPTGREGFLAASHLGCPGGVELLERLFKVGQEITVRVIEVHNPGGKDRVYVRP